jgi:hypothetical protein
MNDKPIPESYWVLPGQFLAGGYPVLRFDEPGTRQRLIAFLDAGFETFIDLTSDGDRPAYLHLLEQHAKAYKRQIDYRRFSFPDFGVPAPQTMVAALGAIDAALAEGRKVYLHCVGGIGRTGTTVGCWLIRHGMAPSDALLRLHELYQSSAQSLIFSQSPESDEQVKFILNWEEDGLA